MEQYQIPFTIEHSDMPFQAKIRPIFILVFFTSLSLTFTHAIAQEGEELNEENQTESTQAESSEEDSPPRENLWKRIQKVDQLYDFRIVAGAGIAGPFMSQDRSLSSRGSWTIGVQYEFPLYGVVNGIISSGYQKRGFDQSNIDIRFSHHYWDGNFMVAIPIPEFRQYELRFLFGMQAGIRMGTTRQGAYPDSTEGIDGGFLFYPRSQMNRLDYGWLFGLGADFGKAFHAQFMLYTGQSALFSFDSMMNVSYQFSIGYYIFR